MWWNFSTGLPRVLEALLRDAIDGILLHARLVFPAIFAGLFRNVNVVCSDVVGFSPSTGSTDKPKTRGQTRGSGL
jgi:hypothetical protein